MFSGWSCGGHGFLLLKHDQKKQWCFLWESRHYNTHQELKGWCSVLSSRREDLLPYPRPARRVFPPPGCEHNRAHGTAVTKVFIQQRGSLNVHSGARRSWLSSNPCNSCLTAKSSLKCSLLCPASETGRKGIKKQDQGWHCSLVTGALSCWKGDLTSTLCYH